MTVSVGKLAELRHRAAVVDDAIALQRNLSWARTVEWLRAVGIMAAPPLHP